MPHPDLEHADLIPTILSLNSDLSHVDLIWDVEGHRPQSPSEAQLPLVASSPLRPLRLLHALSTTTMGNIQQVSSRIIPIQTLEPTCCRSEMSELDQGHALWSVALRSLVNPT
jgi:hypothetical protein